MNEQLWAPWRLEYVKVAEKNRKGACLFCTKCKSKEDKKNFVIARTQKAIALLNIFPYNNGHLMIAPKRHVADLDDLTPAELAEMMHLVVTMKKRLTNALKPHGFNIGINCGLVAGAGIADHIHIHIVPRWQGDTNFMPIVAHTKVIPQSLEALYKLLAK